MMLWLVVFLEFMGFKGNGGVVPNNIDYPIELESFLGRSVSAISVDELLYRVLVDGEQLFAKPKELKLFTGQVFTPLTGTSILRELEKGTELYVSPVVEWRAEFRVYICEGNILSCCRYDDNDVEDICLDMSIVNEAVSLFVNAPSGYSLDFGVLSTGETALIEMNDGYALGKYKGISDKQYFELLKTRWREIIKNDKN